jgi:hypothetical protein
MLLSVILFNRSRSVIEKREFNTEGTKKNVARRTQSDHEVFSALRVLCV